MVRLRQRRSRPRRRTPRQPLRRLWRIAAARGRRGHLDRHLRLRRTGTAGEDALASLAAMEPQSAVRRSIVARPALLLRVGAGRRRRPQQARAPARTPGTAQQPRRRAPRLRPSCRCGLPATPQGVSRLVLLRAGTPEAPVDRTDVGSRPLPEPGLAPGLT